MSTPEGRPPLETRVLACLAAQPELTSAELAAQLQADPVTVSTEICRLIGSAAIERTGVRSIVGFDTPRPTYRVKPHQHQFSLEASAC